MAFKTLLGALAVAGVASASQMSTVVEGKCNYDHVDRCATGFTVYEGGVSDLGNEVMEFCYVVSYDSQTNCPTSDCPTTTCLSNNHYNLALMIGDDFCFSALDMSRCTATKMGSTSTASTDCHLVQNDRVTGVSGVKFASSAITPKEGETWTYCFAVQATNNMPIGVGIVDIAFKYKTSSNQGYFTLETIAGPVCNFTDSTGGGASGDPHVVGFNEEGYDFMGLPDRFYNMFSSNDLNVNAHFAKTVAVLDQWHGKPVPRQEYVIQDMSFNYLTLMDDIGIMMGDHRLRVSLNGTAVLDGQVLTPQESRIPLGEEEWFIWRQVGEDETVDMNIPEELVEEWYSGAIHTVYYLGTLHLASFDLLIKIVESTHLPGAAFIDLNFLPTDTSALRKMNAHGVVGQTAAGTIEERGVETPVVGADADYEVDDLFATNSVHNRFLRRETVLALFDSLDTNQDGSLTLDEIKEWASSKMAAAEVAPLFVSVDTDKDGFISAEEFLRG